ESIFKRITLTVHSSLDAVGLTAAVSTKLAEHDISANIVAGYYHDHIFVQTQRATHAMAALRELSE
ncbi:MAG: ACT domain-containing protein, partial [Gammaproteobacteria bacterium]|nr:ACT domain-containing protein [Gammaproteobacteria bacterium]